MSVLHFSKKKNNKGIAMISIIIAVAFVSIIGSALLYITYANFQMKVANLRSKENFYETDGQLTQIATNLRYNVMKGGDPVTNMKTETGVTFDPVTGEGGTYNIDKLVGYVSSVPADKMVVSDDKKTATGTIDVGGGKVDTFEYSGGKASILKVKVVGDDGIEKEVLPTNPITYRFEDFTIKQTNADGYVNTVKTNIDIQVLTITGSEATDGGIGSFSVLMDAPISASSSDFNVLNMFGNGYVSNSSGISSWSYDTTTSYTAPGKASEGKAALSLASESKLNVIGDYLIVYGDLVLKENSCLFINKGNLTVYGNIYLSGNATIICSGNIYMVGKTPLPGREAVSDIYIDNISLSACTPEARKKHLYPSGLSVQYVSEKNYQSFTNTLKMNDTDLSNDGVINQILVPNTVVSSGCGNYNKKINEISNIQNVEAQTGSGKFYGETIAVEVNGKNNDLNGKFNGDTKRLVFLLGNNVKIQEANTSCTFISTSSIDFSQAHSSTLTKMGSEEFDFLLIKSNDTGNVNYQKSIHAMTNSDMGFSGTNVFSAGDFFVYKDKEGNSMTPNKVVNDMLACGNGSDGEGKVAETIYESSLSFANYLKDFD